MFALQLRRAAPHRTVPPRNKVSRVFSYDKTDTSPGGAFLTDILCPTSVAPGQRNDGPHSGPGRPWVAAKMRSTLNCARMGGTTPPTDCSVSEGFTGGATLPIRLSLRESGNQNVSPIFWPTLQANRTRRGGSALPWRRRARPSSVRAVVQLGCNSPSSF